ncbi:MBL fold metallo-hydrolase [Klebsiella sp. NPDC088457]
MKIEIVSGLNRKAPAAILLSTPRQRILLDAGGALEPDEAPWPVPSDIDAILLSHDHVDHIAGLNRLPAHIPIYCSAVTAQALPPGRNVHPVAVRGQFSLGEIAVTTGSCGHAWGGMWFHLNIAGGLFYSGDISMESLLFRFDVPPPARFALVDASYGLYDEPQYRQRQNCGRCCRSLPYARFRLPGGPPSWRYLWRAKTIRISPWMPPVAPCWFRWRSMTMAACTPGSPRSCGR